MTSTPIPHHFASALALVTLAHFVTPDAGACPNKVPAGVSAINVGKDVLVNGLSLSMAQVHGSESGSVVLERTAKAWQEEGYDVKTTSVGHWAVLSALSDKCMTTLQLNPQGAASGYLAIGTASRPTLARVPVAPVPPGAKVLSTVASDDDGRKGTITVLSTSQSLEQVKSYYLRHLGDDKWSSITSQVQADRNRKPMRAVISAQRGRQRIDVVMWRDGVTQAMVNLADAL